MAESSSYGGYDFKPKEDCVYECPICKKIIRQFTELPCSHAPMPRVVLVSNTGNNNDLRC